MSLESICTPVTSRLGATSSEPSVVQPVSSAAVSSRTNGRARRFSMGSSGMRAAAQHRGGDQHDAAFGHVEALGVGRGIDTDLHAVGNHAPLSMIARRITQRSPTRTRGSSTELSIDE